MGLRFTLLADTKKGNRPSFIEASSAEKGELYYNKFIQSLKNKGIKVETGRFGADMKV